MKIVHLIPKYTKMTHVEFSDITQHDVHPPKKLILDAYEVTQDYNAKCGDIIRIHSEYYQIDKYYFIARDGFEEMTFGWNT